MRKWLAGGLIRLTRLIYRLACLLCPPTVTEYRVDIQGDPEDALAFVERLRKRQAMQWSR